MSKEIDNLISLIEADLHDETPTPKTKKRGKGKGTSMWTKFAAAKGWETDVKKADDEYNMAQRYRGIDWHQRKADNNIVRHFMNATGIKGQVDDVRERLSRNGKLDTVVNNIDKIIDNIKLNRNSGGPNLARDKYAEWASDNLW